MQRKLKILFTTEDFYPKSIGGQGIYGYKLVTELKKLNCQVCVLAENNDSRLIFWRDKGVKLLLTPFCFGNQLLLSFLEFAIFQLNLRKEEFDILHANQLSGLFFILFKPKNVKKIVVSIHNTNDDLSLITKSRFKRLFYRPIVIIEKFIYQKADILLFHSELEKKEFEKKYQYLNIYPQIIPHGADLPVKSIYEAEREKFKMKYKFNKDQKIILTVARLVEKKRIDRLIKAIQTVNKESSKVGLIIIGEGRDGKKLLKGSPPGIIFLGSKKYDELDYFFEISDIFLLCSEAEGGVSLAALQASAYEIPLILSQEISDPILKNEFNGIVIEKITTKNIAVAIFKVCKNYNLYIKNTQKITKPLSWYKIAKVTLNFYQRLV